MNKFLRNAFVAVLAMVGTAAYAQTVVTFNPSETKGTTTGNKTPDKMEKGGITIESTDAAFNVKGNQHYRFYKNSKTTITSTIGNITKIEFTCDVDNTGSNGANGFAGVEGYTFTGDKKTGTWEGDADKVVFTASKGKVYATKVVVTIGTPDPNTVAPPSIEGVSPFLDKTTVTLSAAEGTKIYYTTNNEAPTTASTLYSAPFELTATTTVKAIAVKDGKQSSVAEKTFTKEELAVANSIAEFKAIGKDKKAILKLVNAKVLYKWTLSSGSISIYVRDHSGAILFYKHTLGLKANEDLNGEIVGQYTEYNATPELIEVAGVTNLDKLNHVEGAAAEPKVIAPAAAIDNLCDLVKLEKVKITAEESKRYYVVDGEKKVQLYNGFQLSAFNDMVQFVATGEYDVVGIVASVYKGVPSINLIEVKKVVPNAIDTVQAAQNENAPMYNLAGQRVGKNYKGVVIQNGKKFMNK